jgi:predicted acetyltransferase
MDLVVRRIQAGEVDAFVASVAVPFFEVGNKEEAADFASHLETDRAWVAVEGDRVVGNACTFTRDVTLPGAPGQPCPVTPLAAVSAVGVHPTHRRRGLLTKLMGALLDDARQRGECIAGLEASESSIYGRFGFGPATAGATTTIQTHRSAYAVPALSLGVRLLDAGEAAKVLPALHDRLRRHVAGEVDRNEATWAGILADRPSGRSGGSGLYYAAADDAFAIYRGHDDSTGGLNGGRIEVRDLYGADAEAEAAMWRFLLDIDLVWSVQTRRRPVDDPLRWRLADPRHLRVEDVRDLLWIRILDMATAFEARRYQQEGRLVLTVAGHDPRVSGTWTLDAGPEGAQCRLTAGAEPDVCLGLPELGAVFLGGVGVRTLVAAGRAGEGRVGGVRRADQLLAATPAPTSRTLF